MIKKALSVSFLLAAASVFSFAAASDAAAQAPTPSPATTPRTAPVVPHTTLKVGQAAPDFTLPSTIVGADGRGVRYKLSDFKGKKNVVLAFYVLAFTGG